MSRFRSRAFVAALSACAAAGFAVAAFGLGTATASNTSHAKAHVTVQTVTVIATEFKFKLSKTKVNTGTVVFKVTNRGKIGHDFKIAGKKSPVLAPGKSASVRVTFTKKGKFQYVCDLPGHAANGMKGVLGVGVAAPTGGGGGTTPVTTTTVSGPSTTIKVDMTEYRFDLSQTTVPQGNVTFVITNVGREVHNFDIQGKHIGGFLNPGQSETWTVNLAARPTPYNYVCDVPYHATSGMEGSLTVTP